MPIKTTFEQPDAAKMMATQFNSRRVSQSGWRLYSKSADETELLKAVDHGPAPALARFPEFWADRALGMH